MPDIAYLAAKDAIYCSNGDVRLLCNRGAGLLCHLGKGVGPLYPAVCSHGQSVWPIASFAEKRASQTKIVRPLLRFNLLCDISHFLGDFKANIYHFQPLFQPKYGLSCLLGKNIKRNFTEKSIAFDVFSALI
jgi:hypothetical protein